MKSAYMIVCCTDNEGDYHPYNLKLFSDKTDAELVVLQIYELANEFNEEYKKLEQEYKKTKNDQYWWMSPSLTEIKNKLMEIDEYWSTEKSYFVEEYELN